MFTMLLCEISSSNMGIHFTSTSLDQNCKRQVHNCTNFNLLQVETILDRVDQLIEEQNLDVLSAEK